MHPSGADISNSLRGCERRKASQAMQTGTYHLQPLLLGLTAERLLVLHVSQFSGPIQNIRVTPSSCRSTHLQLLLRIPCIAQGILVVCTNLQTMQQ